MTDTADTPEFFDVDVDQLTRAFSLVSDDGLFGLEALVRWRPTKSRRWGYADRSTFARPNSRRAELARLTA
jgi:hypothetical protein